MRIADFSQRVSLRGFSDMGNGKFGFKFKFHYGPLFFTEIMSALYELQEKCLQLDAEVHSFKTSQKYSLEGGLSTVVDVVIKSKTSFVWEQEK